MKLHTLTGIAAVAIALFSCANSDDLNIGSSLTTENDKIEATSASFAVSTRTLPIGNVVSKSNECYFGRIQDPETGATVTSEFMSQIGVLESFAFPPEANIISRMDGQAIADSCFLDLYIFNPSNCSDSLAILKMKVCEMAQPAEENATYDSSFDPSAAGLLREDGMNIEKTFSFASTEQLASTGSNRLTIPVSKPYTDQNGETYNNYGTYLMQQYYRHPEYFRNSYTFVHHVCPGFSFQIADGYGFHSRIPYVGMRVYFHMTQNDSTFVGSVTIAGTDEVLQTTKISNDNDLLSQLASDPTCTYIKSPAGLMTEVTLPIDDILRGHENDSILAANISFLRVNNSHAQGSSIDIPRHLLLVCKDSIDTFFQRNKLTDNQTSFLNNSTSTGGKTVLDLRNSYTYDNISSLITHMANARRQGSATDPQWTEKHPDWNRVVLVPVTLIQTSSTNAYGSVSYTTTGIRHNMALTSTKLVGGTQNAYDPIKLNVIYAKYKAN